MKKILISTWILFLITSALFGISIRGSAIHLVEAGIHPSNTVSFRLNELVAISMTDSPFIEGLELNMTLPAAFTRYRDSFAITVYSAITPEVSSSNKSYRGKKIFFGVLPSTRKLYIDIPVKKLFPRQKSLDTYILKRKIPQKQFPLILKIEPVMKGIPSSLLFEHFKVKISSIIIQKGTVTLHIKTGKSPKEYTVTIDNKPFDPQTPNTLLAPGIHQLKINSDLYEEYTSNFAVKPGQNTTINITLQPYHPTVQFDFPEGSVLYLDGKKITVSPDKKQSIAPGDHVVRITIGDYTLSKKFTVLKEKNYKISLFLDIFVKEN